MKWELSKGLLIEGAAYLFAATMILHPVSAQVVTGQLGSPSATTTIEGKQIPAPPSQFGGVIKPAATDSTPWWPARVVPPKGAPNVLLIMTDDQGYGVSGTDFKYDGPGPGKGGTGVLSVDGKEADRKTIPHSIPLMMTIDETFDIGLDTRSGVDFSYDLPFRFNGTIDRLNYKLGPEQLAAEDQKKVQDAVANANN